MLWLMEPTRLLFSNILSKDDTHDLLTEIAKIFNQANFMEDTSLSIFDVEGV